MKDIKFCVARLRVSCSGEIDVSYYARQPDMDCLHLTSDYHDVNIVWHDSIEDAKKALLNINECIIARRTVNIPKFKERR